jgi:hypothetical protein
VVNKSDIQSKPCLIVTHTRDSMKHMIVMIDGGVMSRDV